MAKSNILRTRDIDEIHDKRYTLKTGESMYSITLLARLLNVNNRILRKAIDTYGVQGKRHNSTFIFYLDDVANALDKLEASDE